MALLRITYGPMFSGKSTRLLQFVARHEHEFERVLVAKWDQDLRSGSATRIATHDGAELSRHVGAYASLDEVAQLASSQPGRLLVAVDEAQFFGRSLLRLWSAVERRSALRLAQRGGGKQDALVVAGLDLDFRRQRFGSVLDLAELAQGKPGARVERLCSKCVRCGDPAPYTMRLRGGEDDSQVLVGGIESYVPVCEKHHEVAATARAASHPRSSAVCSRADGP
jgi:thymidine kinase